MDWFRAITQTHTITDDIDDPPDDTSNKSFSWNIESILLELLFSYNKFCIQLHQTITKLNESYVIARYITCGVHTLSVLCGYVLRCMFYPVPKPERDESWVNIVCLYRIPDKTTRPPTAHDHFLDTNLESYEEQYYIEETYQNYDHEDTESAEMAFSQACITASSILKRASNISEIVVWSKDPPRNEQLVNVWSSNQSVFPAFDKEIQYSQVEFLHIEYRHPKMGDAGIEIRLSKQLMRVGNQLFSPAFLYRWLKYNVGGEFVFDNAYCVYVMDDNVNQHVLRFGDYMILHDSHVTIVKKSFLRSSHIGSVVREQPGLSLKVPLYTINTIPEIDEEKLN